MADRKANIVISAINKAKAVFVDVKNGLRSIGTASKEAGSNIGSMMNGFKLGLIGAVIAALLGLVTILKQASSEAAKQEQALNRLSAAMKNNSSYTKSAFDSAVNFANQLQETTTVSDELAQSSMALITSLTGLSGEKLNAITLAAVDLAAGLQQLNGGELDVEGSSKMLAKAFVGSAAALQKQGITVTGAAGTMARLNSITEEVTKKFGGRATAETETFSGGVKQLKNNFSELLETIGNTENNALLPFIKTLNEATIKTNSFAKSFTKLFFGGGTEIERLTSKLASLRVGVKNLEKSKDPFAAWGKTIKARKAEIVATEKELQIAIKSAHDQFQKDEAERIKAETESRRRLLRIANEEQLKDAIESNDLANAKLSVSRELSTQEQLDSIKKILDATNIDVDGRSALLIKYYGLEGQLRKDRLKQIEDAAEYVKNIEKISFLDSIGLSQKKNDAIDANNFAQMKSAEELGGFIIDSVKRRIIGEITLEEQAAIAKISMALATAIATLNFPAAIAAAGQLAVPSAIAGAKIGAVNAVAFADGGIVGGASPSGDKIPALLNSGEEVLTKNDRERIRDILPIETRPIETRPIEARPIVIHTVVKIGAKEFARAVSDSINLQSRGLL